MEMRMLDTLHTVHAGHTADGDAHAGQAQRAA